MCMCLCGRRLYAFFFIAHCMFFPMWLNEQQPITSVSKLMSNLGYKSRVCHDVATCDCQYVHKAVVGAI